jgi:hypothetical protein
MKIGLRTRERAGLLGCVCDGRTRSHVSTSDNLVAVEIRLGILVGWERSVLLTLPRVEANDSALDGCLTDTCSRSSRADAGVASRAVASKETFRARVLSAAQPSRSTCLACRCGSTSSGGLRRRCTLHLVVDGVCLAGRIVRRGSSCKPLDLLLVMGPSGGCGRVVSRILALLVSRTGGESVLLFLWSARGATYRTLLIFSILL